MILAKELAIPYASLAVVSDYDCWRDNTDQVTTDMVQARMKQAASTTKDILVGALAAIASSNWKHVHQAAKAAVSNGMMK